MKSFLSLILIVSAFATSGQAVVDGSQQSIVFKGVNIIPMDKEQVLDNHDVVVKNGRITALGAAGTLKYDNNALIIDGSGKYLMPGLAEMHAHVPPIDDLEPMKEVLFLFAANGVTTIRGMLGHPKHLELRNMIQKGEVLGPRFYTSGPSFGGQTAKSADAAAAMVKQQKTAGYDFLKLHPGLTKETFTALAKTAKEVNIPFAGHVSYDVGVWRAIEAGYSTIDHLDGFVEALVPNIESIPEQQTGLFGMFVASKADTSRIPRLMNALRQGGVWVVPTQALAERWFAPDKSAEDLKNEPDMVYMNADVSNNWVTAKNNLHKNEKYDSTSMQKFIGLRRKLIYECNKHGVGLLLGSDAPQVFDVPGFSIHHELQYMVDAGLTPYEALRTGTVNVASFYKRSGEMGTIKTGAISDLILVSGNPLRDISEARKIDGVMLGNKWLSKAYIDKQLKTLVKK